MIHTYRLLLGDEEEAILRACKRPGEPFERTIVRLALDVATNTNEDAAKIAKAKYRPEKRKSA